MIQSQAVQASEPFDFVIPLYKAGWNTQAILEGLTYHYQPRTIHVITPAESAADLRSRSATWKTPLEIHEEESFFPGEGMDKDSICDEIDLDKNSLYTPGWFYQQLLKLGAYEGIPNLSEWYMVWDSDLLPVDTWPIVEQQDGKATHSFALLQDNEYGNAVIVERWANWIKTILGVEPVTDGEGTLISHHMWFKQEHLKTFATRINQFFESDDHWLKLMMRSANTFGTYGEYWCYASWVAEKAPAELSYHAYDKYGSTTERFFDDGTALFSTALRKSLGLPPASEDSQGDFSPSYEQMLTFIKAEYGDDPLPSSLSFESSPRHLKKDAKNTHIEERRSRWNPRNVQQDAPYPELATAS